MTIALRYAPVTVTDVEEALPFYRDGLGLPVANDVAFGEGRWVTLGEVGGAQLVLSGPAAGRSPQDAEALEQLVVKGALGPWVFTTEDLDGLFARLVRSGAEVVTEPADQPWGPREAALRDPSGNMVRLQQAG